LIEDWFSKGGRFDVDGVSLEDILDRYPTPFYLYSASAIRDRYRTLSGCFPGFDLFYSLKANPNLAVCRELLALGAGADVSSMGELKAALKVGFAPGDIAFVGPGKTETEIEHAVKAGIYAIAAESQQELREIDGLAARLGRPIDVLLRINTLEEPVAPEMMVGGPGKFGFDEETVVEEVRGIGLRKARVIGIHVYSASQVLDSGFLATHLEYVRELAERLAREIGFELECVDFGGGFGVPYRENDTELDLEPVSNAARSVREALERSSPGCRLIFEVGRFLVAEAGVFVTRVLRVKQSRGKHFVITDGGMNHFTRPVLIGINQPVRLLNKLSSARETQCSIGGPVCTPLDIIARDVMLPSPERGDTVGVFCAGAYGYTMSMINFMSLGWPAELLADGGSVRVIRSPGPPDVTFADQSLP
jgi:diaminopimelate decarboxylase